jgi:hypothetical protein
VVNQDAATVLSMLPSPNPVDGRMGVRSLVWQKVK